MKIKTAGAWLECAAAAVALVTGIVLLIYSNSVNDPNAVVPVLLLIGCAVAAAAALSDLHFAAILPGVFFTAALTLYISAELNNISGRISGNGIGLTGTSLEAIIAFSVMMAVSIVLAIAASFLPTRK